ncbi:MAG: ABC transporter ATP-binding protein [Mesorhizobium sp.]|uniref:ABC transporter ATP-binding protein n=1 Tax=Mesorhizobium sp. TaxID=1871066 RepID=UPI000FE8AC12|nr:ABC transporter ATP-binding protein [Mesorhizobium sp.]RWH82136.1 MAG: ABC transporter ATP-binding protein [Mesorhizobium sp.]RWH85137.1 MAG: ABC transporter ATP-binding protein [Mesorhizobium sp.]RWH89892.1 MAG: ABC transporter ATP-binding protein [Mesorhizobium sp.]RWH98359.1 MAG: ABC transporter ATP-binding protein [Mesorhizobium sp.]RWI04634.1 MAG: ABC transporter ATP-binding protein [Mesorhizobium sp.]
MPEASSLLRVENLVTRFKSVERGKWVTAVDNVSIELAPGEIVGLVGESGCGKSTLGRSIVGLEKPQSGRILLNGIDLSTLGGAQLRQTRRAIQYVFQDPYASLNDRQTIGEAISEALTIINIKDRNEQRKRVRSLLDQVGLPESLTERYPRELSGGQRQRVAIARSLAVEPRVLICDEPVSALDLSIRAQVMNLFLTLQKELGVACLFIAHDLGLVRQAATRTYVMYLGKIVEAAQSEELYGHPSHPYTRALLDSIPSADPRREALREPPAIFGDIPSPTNPPSGCRFRTRCPHAMHICGEKEPLFTTVAPNHRAACVIASELRGTAYRQAEPLAVYG